MVRKHYGFNLNTSIDDEAKLLVWIENHGEKNFSKYIKELLNDFRLAKYVKADHLDLQRKKLAVDIELKEVMIQLKKHELIYRETFEQTPPPRHLKVMKINVENQNLTHGVSIIDEKNNRIMCAECGSCFVFALDQHDKNEAKQSFIDHFVKNHGLTLPPEIQKELNEF